MLLVSLFERTKCLFVVSESQIRIHKGRRRNVTGLFPLF